MKVIDNHEWIEVGQFSLEIESYNDEDIMVSVYFPGVKSFDLKIYDEISEKFTQEYSTLCQVLDAFIVEQLEDRVRRCFLK